MNSFESFMVDIMIPITYVLFAVATIFALFVGPIMSAIANPKGLVRGAIALVVLIVVFGIAWSVSSDAVTPMYVNKNISPSVSKLVEGGLNMFYILFVVAIVAAVYSEISKIFK